MRINVDRLCELAGISSSGRARLNEAKAAGADDDAIYEKDAPEQEETMHMGHMLEMEEEDEQDPKKEGSVYEDEQDPKKEGSAYEGEDMEEMLDIDEADLVKELRRARVAMYESKKRQKAKKAELLEANLKAVIDQEVKNVLKELQLNSGWIYGNKKPTRSKKGYTHQGSFIKGIGFK